MSGSEGGVVCAGMTDTDRRAIKAEAYEEAAFLAEKLGDEYIAACIRALKDRQAGLTVVPGKSISLGAEPLPSPFPNR